MGEITVAHDISHGLRANQQVKKDGLRRRHTAIVSNSDNLTYGSIISVIEGDDASVSALTDDGIDELTHMLSEARRSPATWAEFLDEFEILADPDAIARIKAKSTR
ncbi:hypothetical protein KX729_31970 [Rhizobium sp. XQZ8]|uniref:hypothetical protein n=1 Tax=Rhizobium populisoli TaxID=2859785 RepID=UPI001CA5B83E|nr:hypothetical protein [Rhizobium populisoli]MBW6425996.1 hypothetical protein [Rhizobium populisoli]